MTAGIAKLAILLAGVGVLGHQLWLHLRVSRSGRVLQQPRTWQQRLGIAAVALAAVAIVLLVYDVGSLSVGPGLTPDLIRICGLLCFACGLFFRVWALSSVGGSLSPDLRITDKVLLVTHGAYAVVRHPFYLSALLFLLGAGLALLNVVLLGCVIPLWLIFLQRIRLEEKMLLSHFGTPFQQYQARVPSLIPSPPRIRESATPESDLWVI